MIDTIQIPNGVPAQLANYSEQYVSQYQDNPLIEALTPIFSKEEVIQQLSQYPYFKSEERLADSRYRFHMIQQLFSAYFQPLPVHMDLESRISRLLRQGYVGRSPLSPAYASGLVKGHSDIIQGRVSSANHTSPSGLTIIGVSGMGKSSAINRILHMIPQVICHSQYKNQPLSQYQVVWMRLECPPDGSIRGLINNFFVEIDRLLGTNTLDKYGKNGRLSANSLLPLVAQIARNSSMGLLIVDEIQNLSSAKSGGKEQMLSFFVALSNTISLPVCLIGTPKATSLFTEFRQARRGSGGQGDLIWEPMKKDEQSWSLFLEGMWEYQWLRKPVPLTPELSHALFEASCGITDIALKTFVLAQIRAITSGTEELTPRLISGTAKDSFKLLQPMLQALRSGNIAKMAQYGDISPINIEAVVETEQSKLDAGNMLKVFQKAHQEKTIHVDRLKQEAVVRLTFLGIHEKEARLLVNKFLEQQPDVREVKTVVQEAYRLHIDVVEPVPTKADIVEDKNDLRLIIKAGKEQGISAYQSLKNAGIIVADYQASTG